MSPPSRLGLLPGPLAAVLVTGTWWYFRGGRGAAAGLTIAVTLFVLALVLPSVFRPIRSSLEVFGRWVAKGVTWVILGLVFITIFVPGRIFLLLGRKDPLDTRLRREGSLWRRVRVDSPRYDRLY